MWSKIRTALGVCYRYNNVFVLEHAKIMIMPDLFIFVPCVYFTFFLALRLCQATAEPLIFAVNIIFVKYFHKNYDKIMIVILG